MKVLILGSGVIGVTTAYMLGARGYEVAVIDRQPESARETSFANGAQLSYSHAEPWATPGTIPKALKWMFRKDAPLVFRLSTDPHMIRWALSFLRNCTLQRAHNNSITILRLGLYSKKKMEQLRTLTGIQFDNLRDGILHLFTDPKEYQHAITQAEFQSKFGCREDVVDVQNCLRLEPALEHAGKKIIGGIHAPLDESGDIYVFTNELARLCAQEFKTEFYYNTQIQDIQTDGDRITGVTTDNGTHRADAYVMAMGSYSYPQLNKIGISVPIYPMKGYTVTLGAGTYTPKMSITDNEVKLVYTPMGRRLRVAGTAEFASYNTDITRHRIEPMLKQVHDMFPKIDMTVQHEWACLRPSTPDGPPIIGKSKYKNLYLNTGHGTLGWTHAAGSAALLADVIEDRETEISLNGLTVDRYK